MVGEELVDIAPIEGYDAELGLLLASLEDGTREWFAELGDLDEKGLVWRPFEGGPSVGALLLHIAHVEAVWIEAVIGDRALSDDFRRLTLAEETDVDAGKWGEAPSIPLAEYRAILDDVRKTTRQILVQEKDSARIVASDPGRWDHTVRWIVSHVVQHEAYHGGQAVLVKRMYGDSIE